jgi:hypothetical protein
VRVRLAMLACAVCMTATSFTAVPASAAEAQARGIDSACPSSTPEDGFADVAADSAHERAIDCIVWWGVASGRSRTSYAPGDLVSRGQMASFISNLVTSSGGELPPASVDHFRDDNGSPHEANINRLAEAGIIGGRGDGLYAPDAFVDRGAMAKFLVMAYESRSGRGLSGTADYFDDDNGTTHEANINKAAAAGFTGGAATGGYGPGLPVKRDQMGSFIARVLDLLAADGEAMPPANSPATSDTLLGGGRLDADQALVSADERHRLIMQGDGNLVLYGPTGVAWATGTSISGSFAILQYDGNFVVEGPTGPTWSADSTGRQGSRLILQNDGNLVLYTQDDRAVWSSQGGLVPVAPSDTIVQGGRLEADESRVSSDGRFRLLMQADGNLVLYGPQGAAWASHSSGSPSYAVLQDDGNFVVYGPGGPTWSAGTTGAGGSRIVVQNDGNVVLYASDGRAVWSSQGGLARPPSTDTLPAGGRLEPDQSLTSTDGQFKLIMQGDGNLVLYGPAGPAWATSTQGSPSFAVLQDDGNFVVYGPNGAMWAAGTTGKGASKLVVQNDGNVVLYTGDGRAIWASRGSQSGARFQMPFPCGEIWYGATYPGHPPDYDSIDWNIRGDDYGRSVLAGFSGQVTTVSNWDGKSYGYGNYVVVTDGNGWSALYAHLGSISVRRGDLVGSQTKLGAVGTSGNVASHLHYEQRYNGQVRPAEFNGEAFKYTEFDLPRGYQGLAYTSNNCNS